MNFRIVTAEAIFLLLASNAMAQTPAGASDDLELPAAPGSAPTTQPAEQPSPAPTAPAEAAPSPPPSAGLPPASQAELDELRRRIAALEAAEVKKPPAAGAVPKADAKKSEGPVNLERRAHARPVPLGSRIGGYIQAQYERNQISEDQLEQGGQPLNRNRFLLRRGRIRFDHGWQYAAGTLELDANTVSGPSIGIRRAEASLVYRDPKDGEATPLVAATLGVTDIPFGYELGESARVRPFMERTLGSTALFPTEPDLGLKVWGAVKFFRYAVAIMNGEPLDADGFPRDPNAAKDVIGRLGVDVDPMPLLSVTGGASFATGKGFHPGDGATKDAIVWSDIDGDGNVDTGEIIGVPGSAASPSSNFERWVLGLDLGVTFHTPAGETKVYGEAFVASNYDRGFAPADPELAGFDLRHTGVYGAVVQDVTDYGLAGFRVAYYDPNADLTEQRQGEFVPFDQSVLTLSPLVAVGLKDQAWLLFQYDFVRDHLARDTRGVPADAKNDVMTVRLQVEL